MAHAAVRTLGSVLAVTAVGAGAGALLIARVVRAERRALAPPTIQSGPGDRPAIVVFGAEVVLTGPSKELASRLRHALRLFKQGVASVIVVSGGVVVNDEGHVLDEGAVMSDWLIERGVPAESVIVGLPGDNTRQTVATMARLTREAGLHPWVAVSTPFHARRIADEAWRAGIDVVVSGPIDSPESGVPRLRRIRVVTEAVATVYYVLPESITSRVSTSAGTWRHRVPLLLAGVRE